MRWQFLIASVLLPLFAFGAIETERNDVLISAPRYACPVGIQPQYIPWGTYGDFAYGQTQEIKRVTRFLVGTMYSMWDGLFERQVAMANNHPPSYYRRWLISPVSGSMTEFEDNGEWLANATNNSRRIFHLFDDHNFYSYELFEGTVKYRPNYELNVERMIRDELALEYSSRKIPSRSPPISGEWSGDIPFRLADSNEWIKVWTGFNNLSPDIYFYPSNDWRHVTRQYDRDELYNWIFCRWNYEDAGSRKVFGEDYYRAARILYDGGYYMDGGGWVSIWDGVKSTPLTNVVEDVLGEDPGWTYPSRLTNDFWTVSGQYGTHVLLRDPNMASEDFTNPQAGINWYCETNNIVVVLAYTPGEAEDGDWSFFLSEGRVGDIGPIIASSWCAARYDARDLSFDDIDCKAEKTELYSDTIYTHWMNGTRRIDWKRIGITCQFLRQIDKSYHAMDQDELPFVHYYGNHHYVETGALSVDLPRPSYIGDEEIISLADMSWIVQTNLYEQVSVRGAWASPTHRSLPANTEGSLTLRDNSGSFPMLDKTTLCKRIYDGMYQSGVLLPSGEYIFIANFELIATSDTVFTLRINCEAWDSVTNVYSLGAPGVISLDVSNYPTNVTMSALLEMTKDQKVWQTSTDDQYKEQIAARYYASAYPIPPLWDDGWADGQTITHLQGIISAAGEDLNQAFIENSGVSLVWDAFVGSGYDIDRRFRLASAGADSAPTHVDARWRLISELNSSVVDRACELGSVNPARNEIGKLTDGDFEAIARAKQTEIKAFFRAGINPPIITNRIETSQGVIVVDTRPMRGALNVTWQADGGGIVAYDWNRDLTDYLVDNDMVLGWSYWDMNPVNIAPTNSPVSVRVDGHASQMFETYWRHKNLRQPRSSE